MLGTAAGTVRRMVFRVAPATSSGAARRRSFPASAGRSFNAQGPAGHSKQQKSDPHNLAEEEFSRKLADKLELAANMNVFEKLVVFADPKTLGRLRALMSKRLRQRITHEVNLDLVGMPLEKLKKKIKAQLGWAD
jgi:protein required for attachment to host cells